jgi:hypothetical protein
LEPFYRAFVRTVKPLELFTRTISRVKLRRFLKILILRSNDGSQSIVGIVLLERMGGRGRVNPPPGTPFHADFNELIALILTEISVDCDRS